MTNPPSVPSLDVEACVRLLDLFAEKYERDAAYYERTAERWAHPDVRLGYSREAARSAANLRALASALPGIMQDGGRLDWLEKCARDALHLDEGEYDSCHVIEAEHHTDVPEGEVWFTAIGARIPTYSRGSHYNGEGTTIREAIDAARAAQPQETSADA